MKAPLLAGLTALILATPCAASPAPWAMLTEADVEAVCENVRDIHPGMRDPQTPGFAARVDAACIAADRSAATATAYADWRDTLQALITSFRDGHLNLRVNVEPVRVRWPGFLIDGRNGGYVVRYAAGLPTAENAPPEGARFLGCDGEEAETLLRGRLDGRTADWSKAPERIRQAYRLFIHHRLTGEPPLKRCRFQTEKGETAVELEWREAPQSQLNAALAPFTRRVARGIGLEWLPDGGAWVQLGNVQDEGRLEALEAEMISSQSRLRAAPYVVFDLRGGAGGNSMWGETLASVLWGTEAVEGRRIADQSTDPAEYGKYWRASPEAVQAVRQAGDEFAERGPDMAEVAAFWREQAEVLAAKPDGDATLFMDECCRPNPAPPAASAPLYSGKAFVLTDAGCFSSSIVVMNTLKRMGAVQVGEPSGQNEVYGESIGPIQLPSGLGSYRVPVTIIRQPRSSLGGLPPDVNWTGSMEDDEGLRALIADLASRPQI